MKTEDIIALVFKLAIPGVLAFQKIFGEAKSGKDKQTLAKDSLAASFAIATSTLSGDNAQNAAIADAVAEEAIDSAVIITKADGRYHAATAKALILATPMATEIVTAAA